ncbi:MAG: ABC transporter permease [Firmicutes bacterium]|nr:ABC transporter permease [Bacillota bacterium]
MIILMGLVAVTGVASLYVAAQTIRSAVGEAGTIDFVFLRLFTASDGKLPPFISFVSFLGPLVGLALGFDAVSGEHARRTLSRVLAQPIHRDALVNGKFLGGLAAVAAMLSALWLAVGALGLVLIGVPPTADEFVRLAAFLAVTVIYISFWLALSILFSTVFRQAATSALAGIAAWLFFAIFADLLADLAAAALVPAAAGGNPEAIFAQEQIRLWLSRLSPVTLYSEAVSTLLTPSIRALGPVMVEQILGALQGVLPIGQSLLLVWPQVVGLITGTAACFAASYILFMRREIRA